MEVHIEDLEDEAPGKNPLMLQSQYVSQLVSSGVYFQVKSGLAESPVRVVLHDRPSGKRKLLVITPSTSPGISAVGRVEPPAPKRATIREITLPSSLEIGENAILERLLDDTVPQKVEAPLPPAEPPPAGVKPVSPPPPSALKPPSPKIDVIQAGNPPTFATGLKPPPKK
jgi:hypothetical protein